VNDTKFHADLLYSFSVTAFLINLDRHPDRLTVAQTRLSQMGVQAVRMPAVDGPSLSPAARRAAVARFHALLARGRLYTPGQIGCALSHHAVYRQMIAENVPAALVFEDDVLLTPGFPASLSAAETLLDVNRRQVFLFSDGTHPPLPSDGGAFMRVNDADCAEAYLITLPAARELLRVNSPMVVMHDNWSRFATRSHIELYRATPATATQDHTFPSVVPVNGRPSNVFLRLLWNIARLVEKPLDALWFRLTGK
jgi:glycosyl transferase family 25